MDSILKTQIIGVLWKMVYLGASKETVNDTIVEDATNDVLSFISDYEYRKGIALVFGIDNVKGETK